MAAFWQALAEFEVEVCTMDVVVKDAMVLILSLFYSAT